jgi:hypothetical protein
MAYGQARLFIDRPARQIAEFILDLHAYRTVDAKLGRIYWVRREGNEVTFRFQPKLLGLPGPPTTQRVILAEDGKSIRIAGEPSWTDRVAAFAAFFTFDEEDGGTWVTRRVEFTFAKPLAPLLDPLFGKWLVRDVQDELAGAKRVLEDS